MNSEQRVLTALRRGQPDRVPVFLYLDPYTDNWVTADPSYAEVVACAKEYSDVIYDWYVDPWFLLTDGVEAEWETPSEERRRCRIHTAKGDLTQVTQQKRSGGTEKWWIETLQDVEKALSIPYRPLRPDVSEFVRTRAQRKGEAVAQVTIPDPVCMFSLFKPEELAVWTRTERAMIKEYLDVCWLRLRDLVSYLLENGAGPIFYINGPEYAIPPLMSPADFEEFVVAYDTPLVAMIHAAGRLVITHCHGKVNRFLERFAEIGTDGLNVLEPPPLGDVLLSDAKRRIGARVCLIGNVQYDDLVRKTPGEVEQMVKDCMAQGAPGGGFILSPCASPYESPISSRGAANLIAFMHAGRRYGVYPMDARQPTTTSDPSPRGGERTFEVQEP